MHSGRLDRDVAVSEDLCPDTLAGKLTPPSAKLSTRNTIVPIARNKLAKIVATLLKRRLCRPPRQDAIRAVVMETTGGYCANVGTVTIEKGPARLRSSNVRSAYQNV